MADGKEQEIPNGDPERGAAVFKKHCQFCHCVDEKGGHKKGPNLWKLWGREAGSTAGFKYVTSDERKGLVWDDKSLWNFFAGAHIPGTKMVFHDLKENQKERADLLSFLKRATSENAGTKED